MTATFAAIDAVVAGDGNGFEKLLCVSVTLLRFCGHQTAHIAVS